jgi:hypothetical protein
MSVTNCHPWMVCFLWESEMSKYAETQFNLVARAWSDPAFKAQLLADPSATLAAVGSPVPSGIRVKVVENTDQLVHLILPPRPADADLLSEEALETVAGGIPRETLWSCGC